jgi:REP element-mobilizing transposase RayT
MARPIRFQYPGACYHIMARGDGGKTIFEEDDDREVFLSRLGEVCGRCGWKVHAWVLMGNHFHMLVETPEANLVDGMGWLLGTFCVRSPHAMKAVRSSSVAPCLMAA